MSTAALNAWKADLGELLQGVLGKEAYVWARTRRAFLQGHHPSATETAGTSYSKHTWQLREANAASCSARAGRYHGVTTRLRRCPGHSSQARPMRQDKVSLPQECPWLLMVVGLHGDQQSDIVEFRRLQQWRCVPVAEAGRVPSGREARCPRAQPEAAPAAGTRRSGWAALHLEKAVSLNICLINTARM